MGDFCLHIYAQNSCERHFKGPRFGIQGVRELTGAYDRPLVMSIFKAAIGRSLDSL
ncbi:2,3-diketo-5-methylthiopentyl-1-phosphate enolase, partial [Flavobacterium sp. IR1]